MALSPLPTAALLLLSYLVYRTIRNFIAQRRFDAFAKQHGCEDPPDVTGPFPWGWRSLGRILRSGKTGEDVLDDIIAGDFGEYHTIRRLAVNGKPMFLTCDPTNLQAMLANQFTDFETGPARRAVFYPLLGNSIFSSDGATWKHSRALLRPFFNRENINNLDATSASADTLIRVIGKPSDETAWTPANDMLPLFFNFTMDTATEFLFGESTGILGAIERAKEGGSSAEDEANVAASKEFADAIRVANDGTVLRLRLQILYFLADGLNFRRAIRKIWRFTDKFVDKALERVDAGGEKPAEGNQKYGLLESLAAQTSNRQDMISQTLAVMFAGRDTTAALLGFCLLRLALHPAILSDLRTAILRDFPAASQPTFSDLKSCRPLQHFMQEVLRLHPTVPINNRIAVKDTTLPTGGGADQTSPFAVRAGQVVVFSVYLMHRRRDLWGEDALEFRPGRWEGKVPAWQWLPFLGGPRVCLGQQFALTEAGFLLVRLLREFDGIEAVDAAQMGRIRKGLGLTMWPGDGVKVRFHKATA